MTKARDIASAAPAPSTVSATEIGYLDGVTSAIQTQIDGKASTTADIPKSLIDAKGDLIVGSAADTAARLAVGTNDYVLTADSAATNGVKWAAPASSGADLLATLSLSGSSTASGTISSAYRQFQIYIKNGKFASGINNFALRFNGDTGNNYSYNTFLAKNTTELSSSSGENVSSIYMGQNETTLADNRMFGALVFVNRPSDTDRIFVNGQTIGFDGPNKFANHFTGVYDNSAAITSITILASGSTMSGDCYIYGVN